MGAQRTRLMRPGFTIWFVVSILAGLTACSPRSEQAMDEPPDTDIFLVVTSVDGGDLVLASQLT